MLASATVIYGLKRRVTTENIDDASWPFNSIFFKVLVKGMSAGPITEQS